MDAIIARVKDKRGLIHTSLPWVTIGIDFY
jgi:hypothetical protein